MRTIATTDTNVSERFGAGAVVTTRNGNTTLKMWVGDDYAELKDYLKRLPRVVESWIYDFAEEEHYVVQHHPMMRI